MEQKWRWLLFFTWGNLYKSYGIIWLNEVMLRSQSRKELKETGSERVQWTGFFFFLRPWAFPISLIFFQLVFEFFFFLAACQQEVFSKKFILYRKYILIG